MSFGLTGTGLTDVGVTREHNEDSFHVDNASGLFVVADGVGGQNAGEVASRMSVEVISTHFTKSTEDSVPFVGTPVKSFSEGTNQGCSIKGGDIYRYSPPADQPGNQGSRGAGN